MRSFSQTERVVINALNAHISRNREVSLTELADECHVAKSTVVKTLQRMGFRGYQEFSYGFRLSRDVQRGSLLPKEAIEGSGTLVARSLANVLVDCEGKKNIVFSDGKRLASLLAQYLSRKLALFDLFAPASYDYAMVHQSSATPGAAFFFVHQGADPKGLGQSGVGEGMIVVARELGYHVVVFTDGDEVGMVNHADVVVRITKNANPEIDLYATKVIMVIERSLAELSLLRGGAARDVQ